MMLVGVDRLMTKREALTRYAQNMAEYLVKLRVSGCVPMVQLLIQYGADMNVTDALHQTPLSVAVGDSLTQSQRLEMTELLLQAGADLNLADCHTLLIESARQGNLQILRYLFQAGARLEVRNHRGDTAVSIAKLCEQQAILDFLQDYTGTDLSEFDKQN